MNHTLNAIAYTLTIGWLYPELMSTYGDRGNIICLKKRCEWRGIDVKVKTLDLGFNTHDLINCNLLFMGGAQDRQQQIVSEDLMKKREALKKIIDSGTPGLYICGAYQFLGKYYKEANGAIIKGLDILDLYTENPGVFEKRLIGNIVIKTNLPLYRIGVSAPIPYRNSIYEMVGFENHGGRTYLAKGIKPLGKVLKGFGNNGTDGTEGAVYENSFCSYFHGPVLPKNPNFADLLIKLALEKKYGSTTCPPSLRLGAGRRVTLSTLDDSLETKARNAIAKRLNVKI